MAKKLFLAQKGPFLNPKSELNVQNQFFSQTYVFTTFSKFLAKKIWLKKEFLAQKGPFVHPPKNDRKGQNHFSLKPMILQLLAKKEQKQNKNMAKKGVFGPKE